MTKPELDSDGWPKREPHHCDECEPKNQSHTPTPWKWEPEYRIIRNKYSAEIGHNLPFTDADATFIVRACNGVDAVLKAGDALLEKIGMVSGIEKERKAFIEALKAISND